MGERELSYNLEEEAKEHNINMGNEETKSNGHVTNIKLLELVETIKILRMEVHSCRVDN